MDESRLKELAQSFLEAVPCRQYLDIDKLVKIIGKKVKEVRKKKISRIEFLEVITHLLRNKLLACSVRHFSSPNANIEVVGTNIIIDGVIVTEVFRPAQD